MRKYVAEWMTTREPREGDTDAVGDDLSEHRSQECKTFEEAARVAHEKSAANGPGGWVAVSEHELVNGHWIFRGRRVFDWDRYDAAQDVTAASATLRRRAGAH